MSKDTGGPAFPQSIAEIQGGAAVSHDFQDGVGMTLRDFFAAMAMAGQANYQGTHPKQIQDAYAIADAMLAERQK